ncbi:EAL domain-containing protein [Leptospira sp. GIMC2001]|uniref:EAL domain-containing protein n=1 Tax=Leptospira sp. GIMC2001 TaxID=1513297 RepID=UPI00234A350A|nr:EAL domain-containing protein [Leptospira sp. GIMC2001]WCL48489.1 EAL domain-containing protein [Leptospira sp. GIMC2001]
MAFQPIWDAKKQFIYSHEALVRGVNGEGAGWVFSQINSQNRYSFDQSCRIKAIELASKLKMKSMLNINFLPNAVYKPETCIAATLEASEQFNFPVNQIIFEVTEAEEVVDQKHLLGIFNSYKKQGFLTAIDDFGAGYSGLNLLAKFQPDFLKIDMELVRDIDTTHSKTLIVESIVNLSDKLGIKVVAEGIETTGEYKRLMELGIRYYQGYLFSKPVFEGLGEVKNI